MKKKNVLVLFMIFITISFSVFSKNDKVAKGENVEFRNGYYYLIGDKEPFTGTIEFLNDNGDITKGNFVNGIVDGVAKTYSSDGKLLSETPYKNGKQNGVHKRYFPNGNVKLEKTYKDGKEEGKRISYYENGKIQMIGNLENGVPVGKAKFCDIDGNGIAETSYENGELQIFKQ